MWHLDQWRASSSWLPGLVILGVVILVTPTLGTPQFYLLQPSTVSTQLINTHWNVSVFLPCLAPRPGGGQGEDCRAAGLVCWACNEDKFGSHCKQETLNTFLTSPRQSVCWPVKLHLATSARWARQLGQHPSISYFLTGRLEIWKIFTGISLSLVHCATTVKEYNEMKWIRFNQPLRPHQAKPSLVYRYNFINYYTLSKNKYSFHKCQSDFIPPN